MGILLTNERHNISDRWASANQWTSRRQDSLSLE